MMSNESGEARSSPNRVVGRAGGVLRLVLLFLLHRLVRCTPVGFHCSRIHYRYTALLQARQALYPASTNAVRFRSEWGTSSSPDFGGKRVVSR